MGISGACRREELCKMSTQDIEFKSNIIIVTIPQTKTNTTRTFTIVKPEWIEIIQRYANLRQHNIPRFFLTYRNGKCISSPVGLNTIGKMPMRIAEYLGLERASNYTGHCFRRSSATMLANQGGDMLLLKRHGGWKSSMVAEGYVENSLHSGIALAKKLTQSEMSTASCSKSETHAFKDLCNSTVNVNIPSHSKSIETKHIIPGVAVSGCDRCNIKVFNNCTVTITDKD